MYALVRCLQLGFQHSRCGLEGGKRPHMASMHQVHPLCGQAAPPTHCRAQDDRLAEQEQQVCTAGQRMGGQGLSRAQPAQPCRAAGNALPCRQAMVLS